MSKSKSRKGMKIMTDVMKESDYLNMEPDDSWTLTANCPKHNRIEQVIFMGEKTLTLECGEVV